MDKYIKAKYDPWLQAVVGGVPALLLTLGGYFVATGEGWDAAAVFGSAAFTGLLFWSVLPRGCQIRSDGLRVVLGWPFALNVPYDTLSEVRPAGTIDALAYPGLRFSTSVRTPVEVKRSRGVNIVVSPEDRQQFLEEVNRSLTRYREGR